MCVLGVLTALQRCLLETPSSVYDTFDQTVTTKLLNLLEDVSLLLLGVLYGDQDVCVTEIGIKLFANTDLELLTPVLIYLHIYDTT